MFCSKCQSLLKPTMYRGKVIFRCSSCKHVETQEQEHVIKEEFTSKENYEPITDSDYLAVFDHVCNNCGHDKAQMVEKGVMYSDEDDVIIFKCGKCGHTEMVKQKVK